MCLSKPVARWQFIVGKWLGITALNAAFLSAAGLTIYAMVHYVRLTHPPLEERLDEKELANELCRLARDGRGVARLLTSAAAWDDPESIRRPTVLDLAGCGRLHVIHHDLEALS